MTPEAFDLAALCYEWPQWARQKQLAPDGNWRSWGFVAGRGMGKTRAVCEFIISEIMAGRITRLGFCSFNLDEAERTLIHGNSGLIKCAPPWFKPEVIKGIVVFPNGAIATPYTPEVPAGPRGPEHDAFWCSEMQSWPAATRDEFFSNIKYGLRIGLARMMFDCTPKARNPLIRNLLERAEMNPHRHVLVRGHMRENMDNLTDDFVSEREAEGAGTQRGREEIEGIFFDDSEGALWKQEWIDRARRDMPTALKRRVISIDPAVSNRKGTDRSGLVELGLGIDDQCYVIDDFTGRHAPEVWGALVIERYMRNGCDCVIVERNRGGDLVASLLRACAMQRGLRVEVVDKDAITRHTQSTITIKELTSRQGKDTRAEPIASAYEAGRVSHVNGSALAELEETMCTWVPEHGGASPDAMDALVHGVSELLGLARAPKADGRAAVKGAAAMQAMLAAAPQAPRQNIATLLGGGRGGDRI